MSYKYRLIFSGTVLDINVSEIDDERMAELQEIEDTEELFYKLEGSLGGKCEVFGLDEGIIEVYRLPEGPEEEYYEIDELGDIIATIDISDLRDKAEVEVPEPTPNTIIAGTVINQDGILGHMDLTLDEEFDASKLSMTGISAEKFGGEKAYTDFVYKNGDEELGEGIIDDAYIDLTSHVELVWVSKINDKGEEEWLFGS